MPGTKIPDLPPDIEKAVQRVRHWKTRSYGVDDGPSVYKLSVGADEEGMPKLGDAVPACWAEKCCESETVVTQVTRDILILKCVGCGEEHVGHLLSEEGHLRSFALFWYQDGVRYETYENDEGEIVTETEAARDAEAARLRAEGSK